jgi:hypothetical protein
VQLSSDEGEQSTAISAISLGLGPAIKRVQDTEIDEKKTSFSISASYTEREREREM